MTRKDSAELQQEFRALIESAAASGATPQQVVKLFARAMLAVVGESVSFAAARLQLELLERIMR